MPNCFERLTDILRDDSKKDQHELVRILIGVIEQVYIGNNEANNLFKRMFENHDILANAEICKRLEVVENIVLDKTLSK